MTIFSSSNTSQHFNTTPRLGIVVLNNTIGIDGDNDAFDVYKVQNRLISIGFTSRYYLGSEYSLLHTGIRQENTISRTLTALFDFYKKAVGVRINLVAPNSIALQILNHKRPAYCEFDNFILTREVGENANPVEAEEQIVRDRLKELGFLDQNQNTRAQLIAAIKKFNLEVVGISFNQIRPNSIELSLLNKPPIFRLNNFNINTSVGTDAGANANIESDVRKIQDRLHELKYLWETHYTSEQVNSTGTNTVNTNTIPNTIAAISAFQTIRSLPVTERIEPGSEDHRILRRPDLPVKRNITLTGSVGSGASVNNRADVRIIQNRLHELGYLSTSHFISEKVNPTGTPSTINVGNLENTIAAIKKFQDIAVAGQPDEVVSLIGPTTFSLHDPTYGTGTNINKIATANVIPPSSSVNNATERIFSAIRRRESGQGGTGEIPSNLRNGSYTPASFGRVQTIASTANGYLVNDVLLRTFYGLSIQNIQDLDTIARNTGGIQNNIVGGVNNISFYSDMLNNWINSNQVPSETYIQTLYSDYLTSIIPNSSPSITYGQKFKNNTGLKNIDIDRMLRAIHFIRNINNINVPANDPNNIQLRENINEYINDHPDFLVNINLLSIRVNDIITYRRNPSFLGEIRQGFVTKAILFSSFGQTIRNLMTDNSGYAIGNVVVTNNYNAVVQEYTANATTANQVNSYIQANPTFTFPQIIDRNQTTINLNIDVVYAICTAYVHHKGINHVQSSLQDLATTFNDTTYSVKVLFYWHENQ